MHDRLAIDDQLATATGDRRLTTADCDILRTLTSSADSNGGFTLIYVLVVLCEIAVIAGLWLIGRAYS